MLKPSLKLSRLPLRSKLLLLAALPLLPLAAASYLFVSDSIDQRSTALAEQNEIGRIEAASELATALIVERDTFQQSNTLGVRLRLVRERTADAIEVYRNAVADDPVRSLTVDSIETEIGEIRTAIGDVESMVALQQEALTFQDGDAAAVFQRLDQLVDLSISEVQATPGVIRTDAGATNARSVLLLTEFTAGLHSELVQYVAIGEAEGTLGRYAARSRATAYSDQVLATSEKILVLDNAEFTSRFQTEVLNSEGYVLVRGLRDNAFAATLNPERAPSVSFLPTFTPMFGAVHSIEADLITASSEQATVTANRALFALGATILGALLFAALTLALVVALFHSIRRPLLSLTEQSREIAKHQLPNTVAQIRELGGDAQIDMPDPIHAESDDEVGELVDAFNQLHTTAVQLAAEQAASRRTVSEMFVNLGRRNQKILMRLLSSLEKLEHNERDPELLQELFKVDHLATRMRRNAESLLVLAGAKTSRSFGQAVPVADVVRSALSEVEDYDRVSVDDQGNALINGKAVADIGHLLAELIENALMFSPPSTSVEVLIRRGPEGLMITVGDRGIGLSADELKVNNQRILDAARVTETPSRFLGLYVVGRLAHRHGLTVELLSGVPSGLIARIKFSESVYQAIGDPTQDQADTSIGGAPEAADLTSSELAAPAPAAEPIAPAPTPEPARADLGPTPVSPALPTIASPPRVPVQSPLDASGAAPGLPAIPPSDPTFVPPAPAHRNPTPPAPAPTPVASAPTAPSQPPLAKRTPTELPTIPQRQIPAPAPIPHTVNPNTNLSGFQRATSGESNTPRGHPDRRRPVSAPSTSQASPLPVGQPTQPQATEPSAGFNVTRRVPGASSLTRKTDQPIVDRLDLPITTPETAPSVAARFGANLAGFQRGVRRADTPSEPVSDPSSEPTAPNGEMS